MLNQPLTSVNNLKILIFTMISSIATICLVGLIPTFIVYFSTYMTKKNQDFSFIHTAVVFLKYSIITLIIISLLLFFYFYYEDSVRWEDTRFIDTVFDKDFGTASTLTAIGLSLYLICLHYLFYLPLKSHANWVEQNPIFFKTKKQKDANADEREVDIIKGEKLKQYSVADELLKWAKLKEDGHISEEEFQEARDKLLRKKLAD